MGTGLTKVFYRPLQTTPLEPDTAAYRIPSEAVEDAKVKHRSGHARRFKGCCAYIWKSGFVSSGFLSSRHSGSNPKSICQGWSFIPIPPDFYLGTRKSFTANYAELFGLIPSSYFGLLYLFVNKSPQLILNILKSCLSPGGIFDGAIPTI